MKKLIVCLLTIVLAFVLVACYNSKENEADEITSTTAATTASFSTTAGATTAATTTETYEEETQKQYYHSAIQGCVIENQDGSDEVKYCEKCESCGHVGSSTRIIHHQFGTYSSSFTCPQCGNVQKVEIESNEN